MLRFALPALKLAIEQRLIARNPADGCALPKAERKEMQTLPVEQLTSFLREAKDSGVFALYYIDLTTGLRQGAVGVFRFQRHLNDLAVDAPDLPLNPEVSFFQINVQNISSALKLAVEQRLIARNPADGCAFRRRSARKCIRFLLSS